MTAVTGNCEHIGLVSPWRSPGPGFHREPFPPAKPCASIRYRACGRVYQLRCAFASVGHGELSAFAPARNLRKPGRAYFPGRFRIPDHRAVTEGARQNRKHFAEDVLRPALAPHISGGLRLHDRRHRHTLGCSFRRQHADGAHLHRELLPARGPRARTPVVAGSRRAVLLALADGPAAVLPPPPLDCGGGRRGRASAANSVLAHLGNRRAKSSVPGFYGRAGDGQRHLNPRAATRPLSAGVLQSLVRDRACAHGAVAGVPAME